MTHKARGESVAPALLMTLLFISALPQVAISSHPSQATPVQHIVIIMQENHSFDNYFGTYPTANGTLVDNITSRLTPVNGIPEGVCLTYNTGCISPHLATSPYPDNPVEGQSAYEADYPPGPGFPLSSGPESMVYFDYHVIPAYWDYAEEYALADNYYAAVLGTTTPNRLMSLTGDTPVSANYGPPPFLGFNDTIFSQLAQAGVSWGYYDFTGSITNTESTYPLNYINGLENYRNNIMDVSSLLSTLASNKGLPNVSFVNFLGQDGQDEHPPFSLGAGEMQTVSIVNAVMQSGFWNSTAIFITYDEGGGFYDHVVPPQLYTVDHGFDSPLLGPGQRVPLLVISPYSRLNYVSHVQMDHLSLLHFIEYNWGLQPLNPLVSSSNLPLDVFDFSQAPRPPLVLRPEPDGQIAYPMPLQTGLRTTLPPAGVPTSALPYVLGLAAVSAVIVAWLALRRLPRGRLLRP